MFRLFSFRSSFYFYFCSILFRFLVGSLSLFLFPFLSVLFPFPHVLIPSAFRYIPVRFRIPSISSAFQFPFVFDPFRFCFVPSQFCSIPFPFPPPVFLTQFHFVFRSDFGGCSFSFFGGGGRPFILLLTFGFRSVSGWFPFYFVCFSLSVPFCSLICIPFCFCFRIRF